MDAEKRPSCPWRPLVVVFALCAVLAPFVAIVIVKPSEEPKPAELARRYVPKSREFFNRLPLTLQVPVNESFPGAEERNATCVNTWRDMILTTANISATNPATIRAILADLLLDSYAPAHRALNNLLTAPLPLAPFLQNISECALDNLPIYRVACAALEDRRLHFNLGKENVPQLLSNLLHVAVTLEALTRTMADDLSFAVALIDYSAGLFDQRRKAGQLKADAYRQAFGLDKFDSVEFTSRLINSQRAGVQIHPLLLELAIQLNILEASVTEQDYNPDNALTGIVLAAFVRDRGLLSRAWKWDSDFHHRWQLGKEWVDQYIAWNMGFASSFESDAVMNLLPKLLIPSVLCASTVDPSGGPFIEARAYSLFLTITMNFQRNITSSFASDVRNKDMARTWGAINLASNQLDVPSREDVRSMYARLEDTISTFSLATAGYVVDSGTSAFNYIPLRDLLYVKTLTVWISSLLAGAAIEIFATNTLVRHGSQKLLMAVSFLTRLATPLFLGLGFYAESTWALPFLVLALFKLGLPMINAHLQAAFRSRSQLGRASTKSSVSDPRAEVRWRRLWRKTIYHACVCLGNILHNMCVGFLACCVMTRLEKLDASMFAVLSPILIQSWFGLAEDRFPAAYLIAYIVLETWWQTEALSHVLYGGKRLHYQIAVWGLLVGHWLLLLADVPARVKRILSQLRADGGTESISTMFSAASLFVVQPALPSVKEKDDSSVKPEENGWSNEQLDPKRLISHVSAGHMEDVVASEHAIRLMKASLAEVSEV